MTIKDRDELTERRPEIDLSGPHGNAFYLMGAAQKFCRQLDRDPEPILEEMKSGDYENLIDVFEREFGDYVDLYR